MALAKDAIEEAGRRLFEAEKSRQQIGLLSLQHPDMNMDDAYAIQAAFVGAKTAAGARVKGWKIGLTSRAMQQALDIDIPDSGILLDDMFFETGDTIPANRFIQPRIEAEIAFVMKRDLKGEGVTQFDVLDATAYVTPSIEILDTRVVRTDTKTGQKRSVFDTIADNAANAGIVLGGKALRPENLDLRWTGAIVSRNGYVEETGLGAGVLNNPVLGIVWLVNRLAQYGDGLSEGDVVLSGSFIRPVECPSGSTITADFGDFGSISCHFA